MGFAVAQEAQAAGHEVTLLAGPVTLTPPEGVYVIHFTTVAQLKAALHERFDACDALIMAAAVGDFTVANPSATKLRRSGGPVTLKLTPTEDLLGGLGKIRRADQVLIGFAVEEPEVAEQKAREEMVAKNVDYVVVNTPAAMSSPSSRAAILSRGGTVLPWGHRPKGQLAKEIVKLLNP